MSDIKTIQKFFADKESAAKLVDSPFFHLMTPVESDGGFIFESYEPDIVKKCQDWLDGTQAEGPEHIELLKLAASALRYGNQGLRSDLASQIESYLSKL